MTGALGVLRAGAALRLSSGRTLLVIERTRIDQWAVGGWRSVFVQREPLALLLRAADGGVCVLAAGSVPVSMADLAEALPDWERVLSRLHAVAVP